MCVLVTLFFSRSMRLDFSSISLMDSLPVKLDFSVISSNADAFEKLDLAKTDFSEFTLSDADSFDSAFITEDFLSSHPEYVKRMKEEGHLKLQNYVNNSV